MRAAILTPSIVRAIAIVATLLAVEAARADLDPSWLGAWIGHATPPAANAARPIAASIVVRREPDGAPSAAPEVILTSLALGAVDRRATEVVADGRSLAFTIQMGAGKVRIEAELAERPISATGSLAITKAGDGNQRSLPLVLRRTDLPSDIAAARAYAATLDVLGQKLPMRLALAEGPHGWCATMDIHAQGLKDVLLEVARTDPAGGTAGFRITLASRENAVMELTPSADMAVLEGTFAQGAFKGPIRFELADANAAAQRRPQDPAPNAPYSSIGVRIPHPAGHLLAGTLTIPIDKRLARAERFPAAVLVSGSGPQNRDEELMGHRPFAVIADSLARAGVAVLRYDDRGVGASTGDFAAATTVDFASDADIASEWLKARAEIDPDRVGMIGHSEGAWVAPLVAAWQNAGDAPVHPLAFTVLLAPPAESGLETLVRQTARMYEVSGLDPAMIARASAAQRAVLRAARADAATLAPLVEALVRAQLALQPTGAATDAQVAAITEAATAQITQPWMRAFIEYDPLGSLARGEVPALAMWGAKDVQVVADANRALFEKIASDAGAPLDARTYDGLNHLFQPAKTGLVDEYAAIDVTFDPNALAEMTEWIARTARVAPAKQIPEASRPKGWDSAPVPARPAVATKEPAP